MVANIGVIIGPMLGGVTSDPAGNYPNMFGKIAWLERFPYSPPNLISAIFLFCAALVCICWTTRGEHLKWNASISPIR